MRESQSFEGYAARMQAERDKALKAAEAAKTEAKVAQKQMKDALRGLRDAQGELEDAQAFVANVKAKVSRLETLEELFRQARGLDDVFGGS